MALENGELWPFYVVLAKNDKRLIRHAYLAQAEMEAARLAEKEQSPICVLRLVSRFEPQKSPIIKRLPGASPMVETTMQQEATAAKREPI